MNLKRLNWDSNFFGIEIVSASFQPACLFSKDGLSSELKKSRADLMYLFIEEPTNEAHESALGLGAKLYDKKLTYQKAIVAEKPSFDQQPATITSASEVTERLIQLALLAGHDSRFKKDPRLEPFFKTLYAQWMINSVNGMLADRVFVDSIKTEDVNAVVTCKVSGEKGSIGLIATMPQMQGKGLGKKLIQAVEAYYCTQQVKYSTVVTQQTNVQACKFYESCGYSVIKDENVYHLWLK